MIGKVYTVKSAMMEMKMISEGYYATESAYKLKSKFKKKVRTPIIDAVYDILYNHQSAKITFRALTDNLDCPLNFFISF